MKGTRYYWFDCANGHRLIRASNASRCLKCNAMLIRRGAQATRAEQDAQLAEVQRKHNEIPK